MKNKKTVMIEYLYLDLETCDRCMGTVDVLDEVVEELTPVFEKEGYKVAYKKTEIAIFNFLLLITPALCFYAFHAVCSCPAL